MRKVFDFSGSSPTGGLWIPTGVLAVAPLITSVGSLVLWVWAFLRLPVSGDNGGILSTALGAPASGSALVAVDLPTPATDLSIPVSALFVVICLIWWTDRWLAMHAIALALAVNFAVTTIQDGHLHLGLDGLFSAGALGSLVIYRASVAKLREPFAPMLKSSESFESSANRASELIPDELLIGIERRAVSAEAQRLRISVVVTALLVTVSAIWCGVDAAKANHNRAQAVGAYGLVEQPGNSGSDAYISLVGYSEVRCAPHSMRNTHAGDTIVVHLNPSNGWCELASEPFDPYPPLFWGYVGIGLLGAEILGRRKRKPLSAISCNEVSGIIVTAPSLDASVARLHAPLTQNVHLASGAGTLGKGIALGVTWTIPNVVVDEIPYPDLKVELGRHAPLGQDRLLDQLNAATLDSETERIRDLLSRYREAKAKRTETLCKFQSVVFTAGQFADEIFFYSSQQDSLIVLRLGDPIPVGWVLSKLYEIKMGKFD